MISIKNKRGIVLHSVEITDKCLYRKELMTEEYVLLSFDFCKPIRFSSGNFIDCEFGRFEIITPERPTYNDVTGIYHYEQKFHAKWERWRNYKLFYDRQGGPEASWRMTNFPQYFMEILISNLQRAGLGDWAYEIDADQSEMRLVEFDGLDILSALERIAETWNTEWWITDNVIHLSRCEYGSAVVLKIGDIVSSMEREDSQDTDYVTRLYAYGSTRNIPKNYRKDESDNLVIDSVAERHLKMPKGIDHVDAWPNLAPDEIVEGIAIFDEVYPHRVGKLSTISTKEYKDTLENEDGSKTYEKWNAYRFTDTGIKFSKDYIIPGEELRIKFQTGALAGLDFAVTFNPDCLIESNNKAQLWEIVRNDDYGVNLPNENFKPSVGDEYVLYGYDTTFVSTTLVPIAEREVYEKAISLIAKLSADKSIYNCDTNIVRCAGYTEEKKGELHYTEQNEIDFNVGQKVELKDENLFGSGSRLSRIRAFEKRLDNKFDCTYTVGESSGYSRSAALDQKVEELTYQTKKYISGSGTPIYVISRYDNTVPSDFNVFSALRAKTEFLSKRENDTAQGLITFEQGLRIGGFKSGVTGGEIDAQGNAELLSVVVRNLLRSPSFVDGLLGAGWQLEQDGNGLSHLAVDRLTVRQTMRVLELLVEKVRSVGGELVVSAASGKIASVDMDAIRQHYLLTFEMGCPFVAGDLVRCAVDNGANPKSYWVEIASVDGGVAAVAVSEFGDALPAAGDECVLMGSATDPERQGLILIAATDDGQPRIDVMNGISGKTLAGSLHARLGNLDGIADTWFAADDQPRGYGLYSDNAFLRGRFLLTTGEDVQTKFEVMEGTIRSSVESMRNDFTTGQSYLANPAFGDGMRYWDTNNDIAFFTLGGKYLWVNGAPYSNKGSYAGIEYRDGRTVMCISNNYILQKNADFKTRPAYESGLDGLLKAKPVFLTFFYKCTEPGTLDIEFTGVDQTGFQNFQEFRISQEIAAGEGYRTFEGSGLWNGTGDFRLTFTGKMYLYMLMLSLDHIEDFVYSHKTLFEQTDLLVKIATESFDRDGNLINTTGLVSREDVTGMYAIAGDGTLQSFVGASTEGVFIKADSIRLEGLVTANENFKVLEDGSIEVQNGLFKGRIDATSGTIGGFEIGQNRIGATASQSGDGGSLAIYDDFFRVGGRTGYVMFGDDVIPASAGGAFSATGRVVNNKPNRGAKWGFDTANYGLFINVSGGTKNYGISSNAALMAPAFINTEAGILTFGSGGYTVDFSQHNIILMYYNQPNYSKVEVELPSESSVASQFGLAALPDAFAASVIFRVRPGSKNIILKGIYNHNEGLSNYEMASGDSVTVLITKIDGFRYQILNHSS